MRNSSASNRRQPPRKTRTTATLVAKADLLQQDLLSWAANNGRTFPWRKRLPLWQALVVEVLLQRTRAEQVVPVFREFRKRYTTAPSFGQASHDDIAELIAPLGLRWRVRSLIGLARALGNLKTVPRDPRQLKELPGVGSYAASASLSFHAGVRATIIDSNVVRVLCRLVNVPYDGETRRKKWLVDLADKLTPVDDYKDYNYALLDFATVVCRPVRPLCGGCPLTAYCAWSQRSRFVVRQEGIEHG